MSEEKKDLNEEEVLEENENEETEAKDEKEDELFKVNSKLEQALRAYADCENEKKIIEKQKTQAIDFAQEKFAKDLLPIADTLELALKNMVEVEDENVKKMVEGVELTLKKMIETFENHSIVPVENREFDPNFHQAIQQVESDEHEDGEIVEIYQKGYKLKDRVIRPSMVTVCKK